MNKNDVVLVLEAPAVDASPERRRIISTVIPSFLSILERLHAGYFRIPLSLCSQALLWKNIDESSRDFRFLGRMLRLFPPSFNVLIWSCALFTLASLSVLYVLRCVFHFQKVKSEFLHHVGVNYLFAPWISWLLLLQSSPFFSPADALYLYLLCAFVAPVLALDVKLYGQWFTKGKRFLSVVANPSSQMSVIGNLVGARAAAAMGFRENAMCLFSLGMAHYFVLFVTLYQRLSEQKSLPAMLRPVFFLFIAAPSVASLAWGSISGAFDVPSKMLFFLSLFLFFSLACRPSLFVKSMKKFSVAWWAYSFPLTVLAISSLSYAREVKNNVAAGAMTCLTVLSVVVSFALALLTACNANSVIPIS